MADDVKFKQVQLPDGSWVQAVALVDVDGNIVTPGGGGGSATQWLKVTLNYDDWQPNDQAFGYTIPFTIPALKQLHKIIVIPRIEFAGGTITTVGLSIYNEADIQIYCTNTNVSNVITGNSGQQYVPANIPWISDMSSGESPHAYLSISGGVIDDLTAGQVDIYYLLDDLDLPS